MFDLPESPPPIAVAIGGRSGAHRRRARRRDLRHRPRGRTRRRLREAGGDGPKYVEVPLAWAPDEDAAAKSAHELFRFGLLGWKVLAELPNPVNFEAATEFVAVDDMREDFACGPDPERHLEVAKQFAGRRLRPSGAGQRRPRP